MFWHSWMQQKEPDVVVSIVVQELKAITVGLSQETESAAMHVGDPETEATGASEDAATDAAKVAQEIALNEARVNGKHWNRMKQWQLMRPRWLALNHWGHRGGQGAEGWQRLSNIRGYGIS